MTDPKFKINEDLVKKTRSNFTLVVYLMYALLAVVAGSLLYAAYVSNIKNKVAVIPTGELWEMETAYWMSTPNHYEEKAKFIYAAKKYINAVYEIDPQDFYEIKSSEGGTYASRSLNDILDYTVPDPTDEERQKVQQLILNSQFNYQIVKENQVVKRFLVESYTIDTPAYLPVVRVKFVGRFVLFSKNPSYQLPLGDLGFRAITLVMIPDSPQFVLHDGNKPTARNPEGWYVKFSNIAVVNFEDYKRIQEERKLLNAKNIDLN